MSPRPLAPLLVLLLSADASDDFARTSAIYSAAGAADKLTFE